MYARVKTCSLEGLDGFVVEVECDLSRGLPRFLMVGLPDAQIRESGERVHAAIKNIGMPYPNSASRSIYLPQIDGKTALKWTWPWPCPFWPPKASAIRR